MTPYVATLVKAEGGRLLRSPTVGIWRDGPA